MGAVAPQLVRSLRISTTELGLLVTMTSLVGAVATVPLGHLVDQGHRVRILAVSIAAWSLAEALGAVSSSYAMLLASRVLLGAVTATTAPAVASLTGDLFPARTRSRAYSLILTGQLAGSGLGLLAAGLVAGWLGWRWAFLTLATVTMVLAIALPKALAEPPRGGQEADGTATPRGRPAPARRDAAVRLVAERDISPDERTVVRSDTSEWSLGRALRYVVRVRTNDLMIVASSLGYFFFAGLQTFAVIFVRGRFHLSQSTATLLLFVVGGGAVFGLVIAGFIADRLLEHGRLDARIVVGGVGYLLGAALLIPGLLVASVALALPIVMLAAAAVTAPNATLDAARLDVVPSPLWGRAESVRTLLRTALEGSAPVLFGFVASQFGAGHPSFANNADVVRRAPATVAQAHGLQLTFVVMLAPLAAAGVMLLAGRRAYPRDVASAQQSERLAGRRSSRG